MTRRVPNFQPILLAVFLLLAGAYPSLATAQVIDDTFGMGPPSPADNSGAAATAPAPAAAPAPEEKVAAPAESPPTESAPVPSTPVPSAPAAKQAKRAATPWPEGYSLSENSYGPYSDRVPNEIFVAAPYTTAMPNYAGPPPSYALNPKVAQAYSPYPEPMPRSAAVTYGAPRYAAPGYAAAPQYAPARYAPPAAPPPAAPPPPPAAAPVRYAPPAAPPPPAAAPAPEPASMKVAAAEPTASQPPPSKDLSADDMQVAAAHSDDPEYVRDPLWGVIAEMRGGILYHDPPIFGGSKEKGLDVDFETRFTSPDWLSFMWSPRPLIGVHINDEGYTSQIFAGIAWEWWFLKPFYVDFSFGLAAHDGYIDTEKLHRKSLGSRVLFREALELGWNFYGRNDINILFDHVSHGNMFGKRNEGLDTIGIRYGYRF